jgi:predicted aconitase
MVRLSEDDQAALDGRRGEALSAAMRVITRVGEAMGAADSLDISGAHLDSCLYHGQVGLDFAQRLVDGGGEVVADTQWRRLGVRAVVRVG